MMSPFSLEGKTILITGASSGIGKSISLLCSKMGANVYITARNEERLKLTWEEMKNKDNKSIIADLTNVNDIDVLVNQLPQLDGIVHCAGIGSRVLCKNIKNDDIAHVMKSNFEAPVLLQSALLNKKKMNKTSSIIFIASMGAQYPSIGNALYSASKGAIISYSKCLAIELAPRHIRVNCISPAMVWTELVVKDGVDVEMLKEDELNYPLGRYGKPEDIANLAIYLLSDGSNWMTGENIEITGGCHLK